MVGNLSVLFFAAHFFLAKFLCSDYCNKKGERTIALQSTVLSPKTPLLNKKGPLL